jgi:hypothetical protein
MAIPVWPSELPQRFLVDGYSEKLRDGRLLSKTSAGPGKARRRFSSAVLPVSASIRLDYASKARFERFWYEDTEGGVLPFSIPDQTHDGLPLLDEDGNVVLAGLTGQPILVTANWLAMFAQEAPTLTPYGLEFRASFTLNVMP